MSRKFIISIILMATSASSYAQSSVTLYGLMDEGVTFTNRIVSGSQHGSAIQYISGSSQGDRWGLRGTEDLGSGLHAIFDLENGFTARDGQLGQGGLEFGRSAYVGLSSDKLGTLTLGYQLDFIGDIFPNYAVAANTPAGLLAWSLPTYAAGGYALDNRVWGDLQQNAIKYLSPTIGGFSFGAMYALGNQAGSIGTNSSNFAVVSYDNGTLSGSLAYASIHNATSDSNSLEYIGGAAYNMGKARVFGTISDVSLTGGAKPKAVTYEAGVTYLVTPSFSVGGGYQFQYRNNDVGSANQITLAADYYLSKRTDVYLAGAYAHDHGFGAIAQAGYGSSSGTDMQTAVRVGLRHKF